MNPCSNIIDQFRHLYIVRMTYLQLVNHITIFLIQFNGSIHEVAVDADVFKQQKISAADLPARCKATTAVRCSQLPHSIIHIIYRNPPLVLTVMFPCIVKLRVAMLPVSAALNSHPRKPANICNRTYG